MKTFCQTVGLVILLENPCTQRLNLRFRIFG